MHRLVIERFYSKQDGVVGYFESFLIFVKNDSKPVCLFTFHENKNKARIGIPTQLFINNKWVNSLSGKTFKVFNPSDESVRSIHVSPSFLDVMRAQEDHAHVTLSCALMQVLAEVQEADAADVGQPVICIFLFLIESK